MFMHHNFWGYRIIPTQGAPGTHNESLCGGVASNKCCMLFQMKHLIKSNIIKKSLEDLDKKGMV